MIALRDSHQHAAEVPEVPRVRNDRRRDRRREVGRALAVAVRYRRENARQLMLFAGRRRR